MRRAHFGIYKIYKTQKIVIIKFQKIPPFSVFILGEKERDWKKIIGSIIVTVGAIFLSLLSKNIRRLCTGS